MPPPRKQPAYLANLADPDYRWPSAVAKWLAQALERSGRSPYDVSKRSGVTPARISQILAGQTSEKHPSTEPTIEALARATMPEGASEIAILHHINAGLVANNMLPRDVPGGFTLVRPEGKPAVYLPGAPPDRIVALRSGEIAAFYAPSGQSGQLEITDEFLRRLELEVELVKERRRNDRQ